MKVFKTKCFKCGLRYEFDANEVGSKVQCSCGSEVLLRAPKQSSGFAGIAVAAGLVAVLIAAVVMMIAFVKPSRPHHSEAKVAPSPPATAAVVAAIKPSPLPKPPPRPSVVREPTLSSLAWCIESATMGAGTRWSLLALSKEEEHQPINREDAIKKINDLVADDEASKRLFEQHPQEVKDCVETAGLFSDSIGFFKGRTIFEVAKDDDGASCVFISQLVDGTEYNTLRSTERVRAAKVFRKNIENALKYCRRHAVKLGVKKLAIAVTYGAKDFSGPEYDHNGETLVCVANLADIEAFAEAKITEDEFVKRCGIYLCGGVGRKRIDLKLD